MLITTSPPEKLKEICSQWKQGDSLQGLVGGQLFGTIDSVNFDDPDDIYFSTSTSIALEDCALMLWIQQQTEEPITVGCQWAGDYQCGAFALSNGVFKEFTVSTEVLMDLQKALLLENTDTSEINELREQGKSEEEIDEVLWEWSDDYRVEARDGLQIAFLRSVHEGNSNLTDYAYFKMLSDLGCEWQINDLPDMAVSAAELLEPIDYNDPEYITSTFRQQGDEWWKAHRERVKELLKNLSAEYRDRKDVFKQIIPEVAAWVLEYAGPEVCSDKDILRLAIEADKTHGYAPSALKYAEDKVFEDREFVEEVLSQQKNEFYNLPEALQTDRELLKIVLKQGFPLPEGFSTDRELVETYVSSGDTWVYNNIPEEMASDPELAKIFIRHGGYWSSVPAPLFKRWDVFKVFIEHYDFSQESIYIDMQVKHHLGIDAKQGPTDLSREFIVNCINANPKFTKAIRTEWISNAQDLLSLFENHDLVNFDLRDELILSAAISLEDTRYRDSTWYRTLWQRAISRLPQEPLDDLKKFVDDLPHKSDEEKEKYLQVATRFFIAKFLEGLTGVLDHRWS